MGGCQYPVDLAVKLARVFSAMLIVLFDQNKMCVCMYVCM